MKSSDRRILIGLAGLAVLAGLWLLVITPKRSELGELDEQAKALSAEVSALEAEAAAGEAARDQFGQSYRRMVVLGKAVPADDEQADLIVSLDRIGERADVEFRSIELGTGTGPAMPELVRPNPATGEDPSAPPAGTDAGAGEHDQETAVGEPGAAVTAAPATEAAAATLPIGATVGPAGLGVMPWDIVFDGDFFDLNRVFDQIDYLVRFDSGESRVRGRLVTVDGFALERIDDDKLPRLKATVAVRSFVAPKGQGATLGATPEGPAATPVATTSAQGQVSR